MNRLFGGEDDGLEEWVETWFAKQGFVLKMSCNSDLRMGNRNGEGKVKRWRNLTVGVGDRRMRRRRWW